MQLSKKNLIFILISLLLITFTLSAVHNIDTFYEQKNPFNLTTIANEDKLYYISVPIDTYITNMTFTITGLES